MIYSNTVVIIVMDGWMHLCTVGYRLAAKEAVKYIKSHLVVSADTLGRANLINAGAIHASEYIYDPCRL